MAQNGLQMAQKWLKMPLNGLKWLYMAQNRLKMAYNGSK